MDDFPGLLARDFGIRPQGKSAPMSASKPSSTIGSGSGSGSTTARSGSANPLAFDDIFATPSKHPNPNPSSSPLDSIFGGFSDPNPNPNSNSAPVYDDDIFNGVPGLKSSAKVVHDDVFSPAGGHVDESGTYDDLLGGLGKSSSSRGESRRLEEDSGGFEELIPGFGGSSPPSRREPPVANQQKSVGPSANPTTTVPEDPFVVLETNSSGLFTDPVEHLGRPMNYKGTNIDATPPTRGIFENVDSFDGLTKSVPEYTSNKKNENQKERSSVEAFENVIPKTRPSKSFNSRSSVQSPKSNDSPYADQSPKSAEHLDAAEEVWLTVSEIPLFTQPTRAPPPSRRPPPLVIKSAPVGKTGSRRKNNESYSRSSQSHSHSRSSATRPSSSSMDELEDFAMGKPQPNERADIFSSEEDIETNSAAAASAAAMKEAMDKAEAKFKLAKDVRERERDGRSSRSGEFPQQERDFGDMEDKERQEKLEKEEREREQRRREKERAELEREKARQAVERATREARERAAADARAKAERAAVEKANAEARQRAERAAVQRAAAEARERAAAEARERAASEARKRTERVAADRAYAEARERAAAAAREKQNKAENDLESFFGMGTRASSVPKQSPTTSENVFDTQAQSRSSADGPRWSSSNSPSTIRKASSATNIVDDLSSIFGGAPSSGEFQEVEGETEERRRIRFERHQRTLERAAKALAEKNERDMQTQREQAERHRIAETLDIEIKRWAAGKEGNLRALLSTMQYVLWPECGWQPVSLTDLITAAAVKKVYRKANLCIHPDKVQQKGANLQQKYIAEKVFDLLKEAWNKFDSEELF